MLGAAGRTICQFLILFIFNLITASCTDNGLADDPVVITEQLLFVSGDRARLSGRLVSTENLSVSDHGFTVSRDQSFANPITISLGEKSTPGRFIGEAQGLICDENYYWKPYAVVKDNVLEGDINQFSTLPPKIDNISPLIALAGQTLTISGRNFTADTRIFFGNKEAQVLEIDRESTIKVRIPTIDNSKFTVVKAILSGKEIIADQIFEYIIGKWEFQGYFVTSASYFSSISFVDNGKFYLGLGTENLKFNPTIWSLDIPGWNWETTSYNNGGYVWTFYGQGFFGGGKASTGALSTDFYILSNGTFVPRKSLPVNLSKSIGVRLDNDIYVFGGFAANNQANSKIYGYRVDNDLWEIIGEAPITTESKFPHFVYGNNVYFITGDRLLHQFNTQDLAWNVISVFPSTIVENGICEILDDKVFVGLFDVTRTLWEYDITTNVWKQKVGFTGGSSLTTTLTSFAYDGIIYVFKNPENSKGMAIWSFKPNEF